MYQFKGGILPTLIQTIENHIPMRKIINKEAYNSNKKKKFNFFFYFMACEDKLMIEDMQKLIVCLS